jgi:hypothetical protein
MRTGNTNRVYDWETEGYIGGNIIYLSEHLSVIEPRKPRSKKRSGGGDVFWNILFIAACLSVLVVLFLH